MNPEKTNEDLKKVFSWIKIGVQEDDNKRKKKKTNPNESGSMEEPREDPNLFENKSNVKKIDHVLKFLDIEATEEELRAVEEMMVDVGESTFSFAALEKIFVRTSQDKLKEYDQLLSAFRSLKQTTQGLLAVPGVTVTLSPSQESIPMGDLSKVVTDYQGSYEKSFKIIQDDLQKTDYVRNGQFFYKEYLDELYNVKELRPPVAEKKIEKSRSQSSDDS